MRPTTRRPSLGIATVLLIGACSAPAPNGTQGDAAAAPTLEDVRALGVRNAAAPAPGLLTAGQPTQEQIDRLADMGYRRFISLRVPSEDGAGWEEAHLSSNEASFDRIPVSGRAGLTRENVAALDRLLDESEGEPTVVYCASSNRVGALLALRAYWHEGADAEEALALGRSAGLASLEPAVAELLAEPR